MPLRPLATLLALWAVLAPSPALAYFDVNAVLDSATGVGEVQNLSQEHRGEPLRVALERWALAHERSYPPADAWFAVLLRAEAGEGSSLHPSPWGRFGQSNELMVADAGGMLARAGARPSPIGTQLGLGHAPSGPLFDSRTYGAVVYDVDAARQHYVLYGIGQQGNLAVVTFVKSNFQAPAPSPRPSP